MVYTILAVVLVFGLIWAANSSRSTSRALKWTKKEPPAR